MRPVIAVIHLAPPPKPRTKIPTHALAWIFVVGSFAISTHLSAAGESALEAEIRTRAATLEKQVISWRKDIHQHPELGQQELRTSSDDLVSCRQNKRLLARGLRKMEAGFEGLAAIFGPVIWLDCIATDHVHLLSDAAEQMQISGLMRTVAGEFAHPYNRRKERMNAF